MHKKFSRSVAVFLFLSLLIHLFLGTGLLSISPKPASQQKKVVEIEFVPPSPQRMEEIRRQIVEQQQQVNDETPEDAKYLSQFNQTVKEETRAARSGEFKNTAKPGAPKTGTQQARKKVEERKKISKGEIPSLQKLKPQFSMTPKSQEESPGNPGDPSQTDDHLEVKTGIQTLLSTREFVYYSYYSRIKDQIRQYWGPTVREKVKVIYRKGRTLASATDKVTQVIVTLNARGELETVEVIGASGVKDLDDAAIEAFRAAAPFPNPPKGIIEKDGRIRIRWDFILEASSAPTESFQKYARNSS